MKIVIVGAGIGGLCLAGLLSQSKHDVIVYERAKNLESMRYDWYDDVSPSVFEELGLAIPKESYPKNNSYYVTPSNKKVYIENPKEGADLSIERRPLNKILYDKIAPEKVVFNATVKKALTSDNTVIGCEIVYSHGVKEIVFCDLLIDSAGANSKIRQLLPKSMRILGKIPNEDLFFTYRAFYDKIGNTPLTENNNKTYFKHLGESGISWCLNSPDQNSLNVLIGRLGELNKSTLDNALEKLREDNTGLGSEVLRGGEMYTIPVRRPLTNFVASGYVAIGDSACMTIPMIGSGIASSMYAAKILYNVIIKTNSSRISDLWQYQYQVYKKFGANHCGIDYIKCWMLKQTDAAISWIFTSGILSKEDLAKTSKGKVVSIDIKSLPKKLFIGLRKPALLKKLLAMVKKAKKTTKIANSIPQKYSKSAVSQWQEQLDKCYCQPK